MAMLVETEAINRNKKKRSSHKTIDDKLPEEAKVTKEEAWKIWELTMEKVP